MRDKWTVITRNVVAITIEKRETPVWVETGIWQDKNPSPIEVIIVIFTRHAKHKCKVTKIGLQVDVSFLFQM